MKVGVWLPPNDIKSVLRVSGMVLECLAARHDVQFLPREYFDSKEERRPRLCESWIRASDVVVSVGMPPLHLLAARQRSGYSLPMVIFPLGTLPRGAFTFRERLAYLNSNDRFLVNCTADLELAKKFVEQLNVSLLPLAYDDDVFFPLDAADRPILRAKYGFTQQDRLVLYAGSGAVSKNSHSLLRIFKALEPIVPDVHLICAGGIQREGGIFAELGVMPVHFAGSMERLVERLALPRERIHFLGNVEPAQLRELYNIADATVNMTLHHDENFGLCQAESMACGAPVIGTAWGGLKDTIVDGVSGYKASVVANCTGVKVNWWEAANQIVSLLMNSAERERLRASCIRHAFENYRPAIFSRRLQELLANLWDALDPDPAPLKATAFAKDYWATCPRDSRGAMYRPGEKSFDVYSQLIGSYGAPAPQHVMPGEPLQDDHVLCLAWPIRAENGTFRVNDPHYPFELRVPTAYLQTFQSIIAVMRRRPAITVGELYRQLSLSNAAEAVLTWMLGTVLLRSRSISGWLSPAAISGCLGEPVFAITEAEPDTDLIVLAASAGQVPQ